MKKTSAMLLGSVLTVGTTLGGTATAFAGTTTTAKKDIANSSATSVTPTAGNTRASSTNTNGVKNGWHHGSRGYGRGHGHGGPLDLSTVATAIGIDQATLMADLKAGQSIADVAQSKGVAEQTVLDALQKSFSARLNQAVTSGKVTSQQAQKMTSDFATHEKQMVEQKGFTPRMGGHRRGGALDINVAATAIGIDEAALLADLKAGQSIAQVAQSKGVAEQTVLDALQKSFTDRLNQAVENGKITSQQEQQKLVNFPARAKQLVEQQGTPADSWGGAHHHSGGQGASHTGTQAGNPTDNPTGSPTGDPTGTH